MNRRRWFGIAVVSGFALMTGRGRARAAKTCPRCSGAGKIKVYDDIHKREIVHTCGSCNGTGTLQEGSGGGGGGGCA